MKRLLMVCLVVATFVLAPSILAESATVDAAQTPTLEVSEIAEATVDKAAIQDDVVLFADADSKFDALLAAAHPSCPYWAPSCSLDKHCDSYCGQPGWGACIGFCCACLG